MSVYRTNDPNAFDDIDGIIIDESAPPASVQGVSTGVALLIGQFQRGPAGVIEIGSVQQIREIFGNDNSFTGAIALKNKKFGALKIKRVTAAAAAKATKIFNDGAGSPVDIISFTALDKGVYGNSISVLIETGTAAGSKKYTIHDGSTGSVFADEVYDNIDLTAYASAAAANAAGLFSASKLVTANVLAISAEPANIVATVLATGSDGTVADSDYTTAIQACETEACNIVFLDAYSATRRESLELHAANTQDRMVIIAGAASDSVATAVTTVASHRDTEGRIIYAYPRVQTTIDSVSTYVDPASWIASILSQTGPNIDPAYAANAAFTQGITGLEGTYTRADYITLKNAGISAFEYDADLGYKVKSGVVTQILNSAKTQILRRRMADFLTNSAAKFLKNYQNAPNTLPNRTACGAAILNFVTQQELFGVLPKDAEVSTGRAKLVDTKSLNTDAQIGLGFFTILWKQRIYSSMRYIVVKAEIGETVTVSASE